jgi:predicted nucleotidyltransferase
VNQREQAAREVHEFLTTLGVRYAFIGGTAVQFWGEPRFTADLDLTVATPLEDPISFIEQVVAHFDPRLDDAVNFARRHRVILVRASNDYPLDISMGLPGYEDEVMRRSKLLEIAPGISVYVCSAEDLIIHKAIAGRPQDLRDIEGIVLRRRESLDAGYVRSWLGQFAVLLENPEVLDRFERAWRA